MHSRTSSDYDGSKPGSDSSGAGIKNEEEEIIFVVDITAPQINLEGKDAAGRLLLAAVSGRVVGRRARDGLGSSEAGALSPGVGPVRC